MSPDSFSIDVSLNWVILLQSDALHAKKSAGDLSRYMGLLAGGKAPPIEDASGPAPSGPVIILASDDSDPVRNGFSWRAGDGRVEISGESGRGLCNGIYSFLGALGISWPGDWQGEEKFPAGLAKKSDGSLAPVQLAKKSVYKASHFKGENPAAAPWRRFLPPGEKEINRILKNYEAFAAWAARNCYDALIFPLAVFSSNREKLALLKQCAGEYGISLEAGGHDLSSLIPRKYFLLHHDCFRMEEGRRKRDHHFCPTDPLALKFLAKESEKLFLASPETKVYHLWPDKGAETSWCSCPSCRAFSAQEQNLIAVNAAADVLAAVNPEAFITYYEEPGESGIRRGKIHQRKNLYRLEKLPEY